MADGLIAVTGATGEVGRVARRLADLGLAQRLVVRDPSRAPQLEGAEVAQASNYVDETIEEAWASRRPSGHPDWEIEGWITTYAAIAKGELDGVSTTVKDLTGHDPQRLEGDLEQHPG
jgi:hypothetical protein